MTTALDGTTYRVYPLVFTVRKDGFSEILTLGNGQLVFDASSSTATLSGDDRGFGRSTDVGQVFATLPEDSPGMAFDVSSVAANGAIMMSLVESDGGDTITSELEGYVSADSNMLLLRYVSTSSNAFGERDIAIIVGVRQ